MKRNDLFSFVLIIYCLVNYQNAMAQNNSNHKKIHIGVLYWSMNIPGQVAMRDGLELEADMINDRSLSNGLPRVELLKRVAGDGQKGIEKQISQMYELIKLKPDAIIVQPTDNVALVDPLREANRQNIPVIAYDQYISGGELSGFITSDNEQAGYLNGEYVASHFPDDQKIKLILVEYPHVSSTVERLNGFLDSLSDHGQLYEILKTYKAVQPEEGRRAGLSILKDFPEHGSIDVIFTVNDGGGLSVVDALVSGGRDEIMVVSIDGDPESVKNIQAGRLTQIDSAQFCGAIGSEAMISGYKVATNQPVKKHILIPVFPVTIKTLSLYSGWSGDIPQSFRKPWTANDPIWTGKIITDK
ncbi:MAG: sugar ABC transporter substrate-binding protein [endosymbiont of Galathealinum brachiosum]|uniref:Sugar ABC transporter substrate-binding protein n=1 Tax=endosymbiont of Galathealinum brachiosum TaxID=2200906 RepID=A0A370DG17_9GAMM|nr:MAG: sugar ABC transporter substrate-binding protein [endosymbiont of Galathealinum brachiosum]